MGAVGLALLALSPSPPEAASVLQGWVVVSWFCSRPTRSSLLPAACEGVTIDLVCPSDLSGSVPVSLSTLDPPFPSLECPRRFLPGKTSVATHPDPSRPATCRRHKVLGVVWASADFWSLAAPVQPGTKWVW
eukprot:2608475-Amphidinium_carterae.1